MRNLPGVFLLLLLFVLSACGRSQPESNAEAEKRLLDYFPVLDQDTVHVYSEPEKTPQKMYGKIPASFCRANEWDTTGQDRAYGRIPLNENEELLIISRVIMDFSCYNFCVVYDKRQGKLTSGEQPLSDCTPGPRYWEESSTKNSDYHASNSWIFRLPGGKFRVLRLEESRVCPVPFPDQFDSLDNICPNHEFEAEEYSLDEKGDFRQMPVTYSLIPPVYKVKGMDDPVSK